MLHLLYGPAASGKTDLLMGRIRTAVAARTPGQVLLVPEQYSHEAERALCAACGDSLSLYAEVLSFTGLARRVAAETGAGDAPLLDQGGRLLCMALALDGAASRLRVYGSAGRRAETQSALLEVMEEYQVTVDGVTHPMPKPFMVLATQNPLEQEGTYPLPEAQVDRFMLKAKISYPKKQEERDIVRMNLSGAGMPQVNKVISPEDIIKARKVVEDVYMDEKIEKYIIDIIFATREPAEYNLQKLQNLIAYGGSPRASISLAKAARAYAFIRRRGYVIPEDVRAVCHDVLRHRIGLTYEAEAENITSEEIITDILNNVIVP